MIKNPSSGRIFRSGLSVRDMAYCSLFALLVGIGAHIRIPLSFVPITLQTMMVMLAALLLGARRGALAMSMYMMMGLLGLPVFTLGGGIHNIMSPTFGFIVGFIPAAWLTGFISERLLTDLFFLSGRFLRPFALLEPVVSKMRRAPVASEPVFEARRDVSMFLYL